MIRRMVLHTLAATLIVGLAATAYQWSAAPAGSAFTTDRSDD